MQMNRGQARTHVPSGGMSKCEKNGAVPSIFIGSRKLRNAVSARGIFLKNFQSPCGSLRMGGRLTGCTRIAHLVPISEMNASTFHRTITYNRILMISIFLHLRQKCYGDIYDRYQCRLVFCFRQRDARSIIFRMIDLNYQFAPRESPDQDRPVLVPKITNALDDIDSIIFHVVLKAPLGQDAISHFYGSVFHFFTLSNLSILPVPISTTIAMAPQPRLSTPKNPLIMPSTPTLSSPVCIVGCWFRMPLHGMRLLKSLVIASWSIFSASLRSS